MRKTSSILSGLTALLFATSAIASPLGDRIRTKYAELKSGQAQAEKADSAGYSFNPKIGEMNVNVMLREKEQGVGEGKTQKLPYLEIRVNQTYAVITDRTFRGNFATEPTVTVYSNNIKVEDPEVIRLARYLAEQAMDQIAPASEKQKEEAKKQALDDLSATLLLEEVKE